MKKLAFNKTMIIIRYLIIFVFVMMYIMFKESTSNGYIIFLFLFIINSQLRYFNFTKTKFIQLSLLIDVILIFALYESSIPLFAVYYMLSCLDVVLFLKTKQIFYIGLYLFVAIYLQYSSSVLLFIINIVIICIFLLLMNQLKIENNRVEMSQSLYDQLRVKETELVELNKELEGYASSVEELTLLRERTRITRELHDHIGHRLSASIIQLGAIEKTIDNDPEKAKEMLQYLREYDQGSLQDVRRVINELKPKEFEEFEGMLAIEQLIKSFKKLTGVNVKMIILNEKQNSWKLHEQQTFVLYRVIQEGLSNSLRHGKAKKIELKFNFQEDKLILVIKDDGIGANHVKFGNGLTNMKKRIESIGGSLHYETKEKDGFLLIFSLPKEIAGGV